MKVKDKQLIKAALERQKLWKRLYSPEYIKRFFTLYDGELEALLSLAKEAV